ncbi:hypothetical protein [Actinomadura sp. J1-007]|uniref:hypothetical protein n=1 Tax=Actinomadura sp. J1-007 TaxID=2661913 RepID=UPI001F4F6FE3|nr:hypothetical protein [Actinomadura sp. J1-007]
MPLLLVPADLREPSQALQFLAREHLRRRERPPQLGHIRPMFGGYCGDLGQGG